MVDKIYLYIVDSTINTSRIRIPKIKAIFFVDRNVITKEIIENVFPIRKVFKVVKPFTLLHI